MNNVVNNAYALRRNPPEICLGLLCLMYESDSDPLISRFEQALREDAPLFFDVEEFEEIADYYLETGQLQRARKAIDMGGAQHPYATVFAAKMARYLVQASQLDEAEDAIQRAEGLSPNHPDIEWARGMLLMRQGRTNDAIQSLRKAIQNSDDPFPIQGTLASIYSGAGMFTHAIRTLKAMLQEEPEDAHLLYLLAINFDMSNRDDKAVSFFETYLNDYPYSETAWYHLGVAQFRQGQLEQAKRSLGFATTIDEKFSAALFDLGRIHEDQEDWTQAIDYYDQSMPEGERNGYTLYRKGVCLQSLERNPEATSAFQEAIELDEELDEAWIELAVLHGEAGNTLKGAQLAQKAIALDPDNPDYHMVAHDLFVQLGLQREAAKSLQLILHTLRVENPRGLLEYARILVEMNHIESAITVLEAGVQRYADDPEMWAVYFGFLWNLASDLIAALEGIAHSWQRFGEAFKAALTELYPQSASDPAISLIWSSPRA